MTKTNAKKLVEYWKTGSELDFKSAKAIASKAKQYVQSSFFLHLSIEKILKAYIVAHTSDHAPYVHNLPHLAKIAGLELSKEQLDFLVEVNDFNMRCRYPDENFNIYKKATAKHTQKLLTKAKEFIDWTSEQLNK